MRKKYDVWVQYGEGKYHLSEVSVFNKNKKLE
jgi:hypothetical protein